MDASALLDMETSTTRQDAFSRPIWSQVVDKLQQAILAYLDEYHPGAEEARISFRAGDTVLGFVVVGRGRWVSLNQDEIAQSPPFASQAR